VRPPEHVATTEGIGRSFRNQGETTVALEGVTMGVRRGSLTAIVGPSGSGKSTLLGLLACLDRPTSGRVLVDGVDVGALGRAQRRQLRRRRLGVVLPQPSDNLLDDLDAAGNLRWAARTRTGVSPTDGEVAAQLATVGLAGAAHKPVVALSGGEQQRLAVLCAAVGDPLLVLADEPTASLDRTTAASVAAVLRALVDRGATTVVATHDPSLVAVADVVVALDHGRLDHGRLDHGRPV
jgi:putative ABC transport system ATP-binding protein